MNISYNKSESIITSDEIVKVSGIIPTFAAVLTFIITVVTGRFFRATVAIACIIGAIVIVGLVEAGTLSFGKAILCALLLGIVETLCLKEPAKRRER